MDTTLRFAGGWSAYSGTAVALALAGIMWWLYFRESRARTDALRWVLPTCRALAVFLVGWILVGPVLHHEKVIRELGRLFVFVDSSRSMDLVDQEMPLPRKLACLRSMNLLPDDEILSSAESATRQLDENRKLNRSLQSALQQNHTSQFKSDAIRYLSEVRESWRSFESFSLRTRNSDDSIASRKQLELLGRQLNDRVSRTERLLDQDPVPVNPWRQELRQLDRLLSQLDDGIRAGVDEYAARNQSPEFKSLLKDFDAMTRWQRVQRTLLDPEHGELREVIKSHDVEFLALRDGKAQPLWWQRRGGKKSSGVLPTRLALSANGLRTDLGDALSTALGSNQHGAGVLLLTDGQHNAIGSSPVALSRLLGEKGIPVFAVGFGSNQDAEDMALTDVDGPQSVYADDLIRGDVVVSDQMQPGAKYRVKIECDKEIVWQQDVVSEGSGERRIAFEFPVKQLFEGLKSAAEQEGAQLRNAPLEFAVSIVAEDESVAGREKLADNNQLPFTVQAVTQFRKLLILDGRQRWETRYLRNMFERLPQWEVHAFLDGIDMPSWKKSGAATFPSSVEDIYQYELIVIGDLPSELFGDQKDSWIRDFVGKRGGGLIFLDGRRGHLATLGQLNGGGIGDLLPVEFDEDHRSPSRALSTDGVGCQLSLTEDGARMNALRLVGSDDENKAAWSDLPSPHWVAPAVELPGSTVYLRASDQEGRDRPVLVHRRFGAGRVLYAGTDELWRWRFNVGDRFHQKFWMQIANWIAYPPYSVDGEFVSIGTDQSVYDPNSSVAFHVAVRDDQGRPVTDSGSNLSVVLQQEKDGESVIVGEVPLQDDGDESGIFRGRSDKLAAGRYQIRVRQKRLGTDREYGATAELIVKETRNREIADLRLNRELLQSMALYSGGEYFDEEQVGGLTTVLNRRDQKKVISSETSLWDSWWWFVPVMLLLTVEWMLRKRSGYV